MLLNLLKNAAYAIRETDRTARSTLAPRSTATSAVIAVDDNGCGMTPEVRQRIWEPFFTTKGAARHRAGAGRRQVDHRVSRRHDRLRNVRRPGATFTIRLPKLESGERLRAADRPQAAGRRAGWEPSRRRSHREV